MCLDCKMTELFLAREEQHYTAESLTVIKLIIKIC